MNNITLIGMLVRGRAVSVSYLRRYLGTSFIDSRSSDPEGGEEEFE